MLPAAIDHILKQYVGAIYFCSGQIALLPDGDDSLLQEGVTTQCRQALENMGAVVYAAGTGWENVVKVNVSLGGHG